MALGGYDVGKAFIQVVPSFENAQRQIQEFVDQIRNITVAVNLDDAAMAEQLRAATEAAAATAKVTIPVDTDTAPVTAKINEVGKDVQDVDIPVRTDTAGVTAQIHEVGKDVQGVDVPVHADLAQFNADLAAAQARRIAMIAQINLDLPGYEKKLKEIEAGTKPLSVGAQLKAEALETKILALEAKRVLLQAEVRLNEPKLDLAEVNRQLNELRATRVEIPVDGNLTQLDAKIAQEQAKDIHLLAKLDLDIAKYEEERVRLTAQPVTEGINLKPQTDELDAKIAFLTAQRLTVAVRLAEEQVDRDRLSQRLAELRATKVDIPVDANLTLFDAAIAQERAKDLRLAAKLDVDLRAYQEELVRLQAEPVRKNVDLKPQIAEVAATIAALEAQRVIVQIRLDAPQLDSGEIARQIAELKTARVDIPVDADLSLFDAKIKQKQATNIAMVATLEANLAKLEQQLVQLKAEPQKLGVEFVPVTTALQAKIVETEAKLVTARIQVQMDEASVAKAEAEKKALEEPPIRVSVKPELNPADAAAAEAGVKASSGRMLADGERATAAFAEFFSGRIKFMGAGITSLLPVLAAVVPVIAVGIGALVTAALTSVFVGVAFLAQKSNAEVVRAYTDLGRDVSAVVKNATDQLAPIFVGSFHAIDAAVQGLGPQLTRAFTAAGPAIVALTNGIIALATNAMPGLTSAVQHSLPVMEGLARFLGTLGTAFGDMVRSFGEHSGALGTALASVGTVLAAVVRSLTDIINLLGDAWARNASSIDAAATGISTTIGNLATAVLPTLTIAVGFAATALKEITGALNLLGPLAPVIGTIAAAALGLWAAFKLGGLVSIVIGGLASAVTALGGVMIVAGQRTATLIAGFQGVAVASSNAATVVTASSARIATGAAAAGAALTRLAGPLSILLIVGTAAYAAFSSGQDKAKASEDALKAATDSMTAAFLTSHGAINKGVEDSLHATESYKTLADAAAKAGVGQDELTHALLTGGPALDGVKKKLEDQVSAHTHVAVAGESVLDSIKAIADHGGGAYDDIGQSAKDALTALGPLVAVINAAKIAEQELAKKTEEAARAMAATPEFMQAAKTAAEQLHIPLETVLATMNAIARGGGPAAASVAAVFAATVAKGVEVGNAEQKVADGIKALDDAVVSSQKSAGTAANTYQKSLTAVTDAQHSYAKSQDAVVEAHQGVVDAERGVGAANRALQDSYQGVTDAEEGVKAAGRALQDAYQGVTDAERAVGAANRALQDSYQGVVDAERAVGAANRALNDAYQGVIDAENAVGAANRALQDSYQGVVDAQRAAAASLRSLQDAYQGVTDAQRAAAAARRGVADANLEVTTAEQNLAKAQQQSVRDQVALNVAREKAVVDLKALQLQLADQVVSEEQARQQLFDTKLTSGLMGVTSKNAARIAAQKVTLENEPQVAAAIALMAAQNQLNDVLHAGTNLRKDAAKADKDGVEGSAAVRAAQAALRTSQEQVISATRALTKAHQAADDAVYAVGAADRALTRAHQGVSDAAYAVGAADRALVRAHQGVTDAANGVGAANRNLTRAHQGVSDAADGVGAAHRNLVKAHQGVRDAADGVGAANRNLVKAHQGVFDAANGVGAANRNLIRAHQGVTDAINGVDAANRNLVRAHKGVEDAVYAVGRADDALKDAKLASRTASEALIKAEDDLRIAQENRRGATDLATQAGRDQYKVLSDLAKLLLDPVNPTIDQGNHLIDDTATRLHISKDAAEKLLTQWGLLSKDWRATYTVQTVLPPPQPGADPVAGESGWSKFWTGVGHFFSLSSQANTWPFNAEGGLITGPGTGTSDEIPHMLSNGEFVVTAAATARHLPQLEAWNAGDDEGWLPPGFTTTGGHTGSPQALPGQEQWGLGARSGGGGGGNITVHARTDASPEHIAHTIDRHLALAARL